MNSGVGWGVNTPLIIELGKVSPFSPPYGFYMPLIMKLICVLKEVMKISGMT